MKYLLILTMLFIISINCHHARVKLENENGGTKGEVKMLHYSVWWGGLTHTWKIWSQFGNRKVEIDATHTCPTGVYEIDEYYRWQDAVWTQVTLGVYVPRTLKITCNN